MTHQGARDVKYVAIAAAIAMLTLALHLGKDASSRRVFNTIMILAVSSIAIWYYYNKAYQDTSEDIHSKDLESFSLSLLDDETDVLDPDVLSLRRTTTTHDHVAMNPEVAWAMLQMRPYTRANKGRVARALHFAEHFFKSFYDVLRMDNDEFSVVHAYKALRDTRADLLNTMTSLVYAKPFAHVSTKKLLKAIDIVKWRTYRALKTLHNKYGKYALRAEDRGPPYAYDARLSTDNQFRVHV